jgi:hypothetical protein
MFLAVFARIVAENTSQNPFEDAWATAKEAVALVAKSPRR